MIDSRRLLVQANERFRRWRAATKVAQLEDAPLPRVREIGSALRELLNGNIDLMEETLWTSIEARRSELLACSDPIQFIDYGAGAPEAHRTAAEMRSGLVGTSTVMKVCTASKPPFWGALLFKLIKHSMPTSVIELGTCVGISAAYQGAALLLNRKGHAVTLDGSPEVAEIARTTMNRIGLRNVSVVTGPFHETLTEVLKRSAPIDFFFNDGHHDHDAVLEYFTTAFPYLASDALVVFDDISWSQGMRQAWKEIRCDRRIAASVDLGAMGIVVVGESSSVPIGYNIEL